MNWSVIFEPDTLALYGQGLVVTLQLTLYSLGLGAVLALVCALALVSPRVWLRWPAQTFTYFMRGTPLLIQVYLIYYGVAQLEWVQARWDAVSQTEICQKWWASMRDLMPSNPDNSPESRDLREVFHLA